MRDRSAIHGRLHAPVLVLLVAAAPVLAQVETTPEAEAERWWSEAMRFVDLKQTAEALAALDTLIELKRLHPELELPRRFWVVHAATAEVEGLHDVAVASAQRYVNQPQANAADHYAYAIQLVFDAYRDATLQSAGDREIYTVSVGGRPVDGMEPPVRRNTYSYRPRRTREAVAAGVYGAVVVGYIVNEKGRVEYPAVLQDPGYGLAAGVVTFVKRSRYRPAMLHGEPVAVFQIVTINFPPLP
ncbi:MAG: energy transducer TonB [Acidobacteria bacterium]|nr:energy transducer TonB [Acidobacteriota bacterium]